MTFRQSSGEGMGQNVRRASLGKAMRSVLQSLLGGAFELNGPACSFPMFLHPTLRFLIQRDRAVAKTASRFSQMSGSGAFKGIGIGGRGWRKDQA